MIANTAAYHFAVIDAPQDLCDQLQARAEAAALRGTVLVAGEGINLFLAGAPAGIDAFYAALQADARFAGMRVKTSYSEHQPFARLKAKVKPEIISFRRDDGQPLDYPRAPAVDPATVQRWLRQGHDDAGKPVVMLDTRNLQEVAYGTFKDALVLPIHKFTDLPDALAPHRQALKDSTVVSFCTGGIRCEKAALWMANDGMDNVLQLDGGILGYFEAVGGEGYEGRCFVFDERVALDAQLAPLVDEALPEPQPSAF
ncbi:sulfurtransferase [Stenotrophomonas sp. 24(2023)]|uniref:sulfurtransferase n=1 Tax=Stenotrophomonas sp. 24(2023) TaxID=3068324 RepID=UPI0027DFDFAE|nr:sulfurtransferase [Stenotrophomonas sp. 24(2023)]WMJ68663.1 sulfurtransferase [Stenotrophomonas sp. 24(2023)]